MRARMKDLVGTILVAAIAVPYIGFLVRGEMPLIKDPRGMSATGLVLGAVAFLVLRYGDGVDAAGRFEIGLGLGSLALGLVALLLAESAVAELLLAAFMASILLVWASELTGHLDLFGLRDQAA